MRLVPAAVAALLMCLAAGPVQADAAIAWEELCAVGVCRGTGHDGAMAARVSPDGRRVAVSVLRAAGATIEVYRLDGSRLGSIDGHSPEWLPDGSALVHARGGSLWLSTLDQAPGRVLAEGFTDLRGIEVAPDGRAASFISARAGHQDVWLVGLDGSATPRQITVEAMPAEEARFGHAWSPDSRRIAYFSNAEDTDADDLWVVDVATGDARRVSSGFMGSSTPAWSPDGRRIASYGVAKTDFWYSDLSDVFVVEPATGREWALPMQGHAREVGRPGWSADGQRLRFLRHERGRVHLWQAPVDGGVATRLSHGEGLVHDWHAGADHAVLVRSTATRGREVELLPFDGGAARVLTAVSTPWPGLVQPEEISFPARDGLAIQAFVFHPPGFDPARRYPTVVQAHGGGTHSYYDGLNLVEQRLAQRGYVVLAVNYRGGSGFGRAFQDLGAGDWANTQSLDAADAAHFVRRQPWSNQRVGIYGYSYGGIVSLGAVARDPEAFDAAVPMGGIYDFADAYRNADRLGRLFTAAGHLGSPDSSPDAYAASDTVSRLDQVRTPVLLMHGEADVRAPFRQFQLASAALARTGAPFEAHSYPDEPHAFLDPANRVDMYRRLEAWMDRWLRTEGADGG